MTRSPPDPLDHGGPYFGDLNRYLRTVPGTAESRDEALELIGAAG